MFQSLRLRTWLLLLLTTGFTLVVCGLIYYRSAQSTIKASLLDNASLSVRTGSDSVAVRVDDLIRQAASLRDRIPFERGSEERFMTALQQEWLLQGTFRALGFSDREGRLRMTNGTAASIRNEPAFASALQGASVIRHAYQLEAFPDEDSAYILLPVYDRTRLVSGVLVASVPIGQIGGSLSQTVLRLSENERVPNEFALLDRTGNALYSTYTATRLTPEDNRTIVRALASRKETTIAREGSRLFASAVPGTEWSLVLVVPTDKLYKPLHQLLLRTIAICLAMELALAVLFLLLITPPFKRIREILKTTEAVAAGYFHAEPLKPGMNDEIGALASSVNGMVEQLRNLFEPLQAVTNQNDYGIIVTDRDYRITQFNDTAQRMLGYSADEVVGKMTPLHFSSMEELEAKAKRLSGKLGRTVRPGLEYFRAMLAGRMSYSEERIYIRKNREPIPVFLNVSKIVDKHGRVTGYVGLFRDITKQKEIQAELTRAKQSAEEANMAKSVFLARMSHEIRTPINGIVGLSQLLQRTELTEAQRDYLQKIVTSSEVLLGIVNDILDFSKIEAGKFELEQVAFEPEELFRKLGDTLSIFLSKKQLEMIFDVPDSLPQRLIGDPLRLEQILLNLANNAIKFTNRGHVHFRVRMPEASAGRVKLEFSVADTGIGISEEQMAHLFQPFSQADGSTSRKYGGTGLGLVIADELVSLMGGRLEAESEPGQGSRFFFSLSFPVATGEAAPRPAIPAGDVPRSSVLCIERPGLMQNTLRGMLASCNAEAVFADSWKSALALLGGPEAEKRFDFVICNMEMPDMYGEETWRKLQEAARPALTIAMTTPYGQSEWLRMEGSARPDRMLIKPVNRRALRNLIESIRQEREHGSPEAPRKAKKKSSRPDKPRILLAEDHTINQQVACELLHSRGYETGIASNGREALELLRRDHWDLVLMDLHMPEMDGIEASRAIRARRSGWQLPIVAMTANVIMEDRVKCLNAGMNDVVTKPIRADVLFEVVDRWLRHARQIDWEDALDRVNGKESILRHMLRTFGQEYDGFADVLRGKLEGGEGDAAAKLLHTLKGVAGNLSARAVFAAAESLEAAISAANGGLSTERWIVPFTRLEKALKELLTAIELEESRASALFLPTLDRF
ncbi:response regulator [Cohnella xylanilytica]|uniref:Circadian input-output histidine kinase CikA n=1 Tax=Cohnella xylanilytica TaxID=557555 RepID=A0A841U1N1_9BACL|nr:response regulator [Cohnella xylanilytica]MBB6693088.1 response regulator [Cohnella xylanilytica]